MKQMLVNNNKSKSLISYLKYRQTKGELHLILNSVRQKNNHRIQSQANMLHRTNVHFPDRNVVLE